MFRILLKDGESKRSGSKYRQYSPTAVANAMEKIRSQQMSVYKAAKVFNIPETTLRDRKAGRISDETVKSGPSTLLSLDEEATLVKHLNHMAALGYGYTRTEVLEIASEYTSECGKRLQEKSLSKQWYVSFIQRWPELTLQKGRSLSLLRAKSATQETIDKYFAELESIMRKYDLMDKPHCIYNVDEKGVCPAQSSPNVVAGVGSKPQCVTSERSFTVTIIGCGNAVGTQLPPYFIFPGARMRPELLDGCTSGSNGTVSESGWSNAAIFKSYMKKHFVKYVQGLSSEQPVIVIYDGHKSHVSLELIEWAKQQNIILFVLPAHTSHLLQPLDVGCFGPLNRILSNSIHAYMRSNHTNVTRYVIGRLASKAYTQALSTDNLKSSFRKTGIFPFETTVIQPEKLMPSTVTSKCPEDCKTTTEDRSDIETTILDDDMVSTDKPQSEVNETDFDKISSFVQKLESKVGKGGEKCVSKKRKVLSTVVAGKAITEDDVVSKIQEHVECQSGKGSARKGKSRVKSKNVKSKSGKENVCCENVSAKKVKRVKENTISNKQSQVPGPSGCQKIIVSDEEFDSDSSDDDEKCCACEQSRPEAFKKSTSLLILNWGQCMFGECKHWTHLKFCCSVNVLRRHSVFYCPCHGLPCLQN